ncbi:uncharacterized protein [Palaemon carinicauda]|uniref:uncharacterized protein n=1 Tax=Palaemon carinicauda TaxID=392227 RepID=UPI0035B6591F
MLHGPPKTASNTGAAHMGGRIAIRGESASQLPKGRTMLNILPVLVNGTHATYGFIDSGAAPTLAARSRIDQMGLKGRPYNQIKATEASTFTCKEVLSLHIGNINTDEGEHVTDVLVADKINVSMDHAMSQEWLTKWPHLSDLEVISLPEYHRQVELIIGLDTTLNRVILDQRHGLKDEPSAYLTKLGWVVFGPTGTRSTSECRAHSLKKKVEANETYKTIYVKQVEKYLLKGYAELVPVDKLNHSDGRVSYMAHHGDKHPTKEKLRVFFDLKAKHAGTSLNDHLMQGPDLTSSLAGVLLRFREEKHAVTTDIQEMFHQVKVPEDDSNSLRFLWWPGGDTNQAIQEFRMTSRVFGARSSPSVINFCLRQAALDYGDKYGKEACCAIRRNFYVDNLLKSIDSEEDCIQLTKDLIGLCADGGFRLNQWTSSNKDILAAMPERERDKSVVTLDLSKDERPTEHALSIHWDMSSDEFTFKINLKEKPRTRRGVLSVVASLYDPLGFVAPFTLKGKMLLQDLCRRNLPWDEDMNNDEANRWSRWTSQLQCLGDFKIRRSLVPPDFGEVSSYQLHHFADASQTGYGVVTCLRTVSKNNQVNSTLVMGRARVAPLKRSSIPQMELTAAAVAAQLDYLASRSLDVDKLLESSLWLTRPEFLCQEQDSWPALPNDVKRAEIDGDPEVKQSAPIFSMFAPEPILVEKIAAKFSSRTKIVRIIA